MHLTSNSAETLIIWIYLFYSYVSVADELPKADDDKPTIGLLICKDADKTTVEWVLRDLDRPLGVATYQLEQVVERTVKELELKKQNKK